MVPFAYACLDFGLELQARVLVTGSLMLVNNPNERFVYETHDSAWRDKDPHGFIGIEDSSEEVLVLGAVEKPQNFDDLTARYNRCKRSSSNYDSIFYVFSGTLFMHLLLTTESTVIVPEGGFVLLCS